MCVCAGGGGEGSVGVHVRMCCVCSMYWHIKLPSAAECNLDVCTC